MASSLTPGVRVVLALVALLPMSSLAWLSIGSYRNAAESAEAAEELEAVAERINQMVVLDSNLAYEGYFDAAVKALENMGVPVELTTGLLGIDLVADRDRARLLVDGALDDLGLVDVRATLDERRRAANSAADMDPVGVRQLYEEVAARVGVMLDVEVGGMTQAASALPNADDLDRAKQLLVLAIHLREDAASLVSGAFGVRFSGVETFAFDGAVEFMTSGVEYQRISAEIEALLDGGAVADAWAGVSTTSRLERLISSTQELANTIIASGIGSVRTLDIEEFGSVAGEARSFTDSVAVLEDHVAVVDAAAADLGAAARRVGDVARSSQRSVMLTIVAIAVVAVAAVAVGGRWIVAPLRSMGRHVETMRSGDLSVRVAERGPREVASAAQALNEATEHLRLAEAQVVALAGEDLTNPVLDEEGPGKLGESLQGAVARLTDSLSEREQFRRRLAHESTHDGLTGLLNRAAVVNALGHALARAQRSRAELAVMIIDLDGFKAANDRFGHNGGDRVLRTTAKSIVAGVREGDVVGRLGSDEFVVVAEAVGGVEDAVDLARRIRGSVAQIVDVEGESVTIDACVGVALASSGNLTADEMMRDADLAVYRAKELGGHRVEVCDVELRRELADRASTEAQLRSAIEGGEMEVHYQTIHTADDLRPYGVEALVRWRQPDGSVRLPDSFIPVAERSDLIVSLDNAVLDLACAQLAAWQNHPRFGDLQMAVNVSARHLATGTLVSDVSRRVEAFGISHDRIGIEVTESSILADLDSAAHQLQQLRRLGSTIGIDDFGTGYTSLAHLRQLPFDVLKIDRSFVANLESIEDRTLVKLIVDTGHTLGARVVGEGVETSADVQRLRDLDVDLLQGYNFSRPVPSDDVESLILSAAEVAAR